MYTCVCQDPGVVNYIRCKLFKKTINFSVVFKHEKFPHTRQNMAVKRKQTSQ